MILNKLIDFSLRQKFVAISLVILMALAGLQAIFEIPINSLPDVTPVQVLVITKAGRYSPYDVEKLVSFPIENTMNGLPKVKEVRSISQFGLSAVTIEFDEDTDIYFARQMISQRLQTVLDELPDGVSTPQLGPISTALGEIYQYQIVGDGASLTELRTIQDWIIAPQLKTIKGVTEINSFGGYVKQFDVIVSPQKLMDLGIGINDVIIALEENNSVSGGNFLEHNREQYIIRGFGLITDIVSINDIIVKNINGRPIFIRDIAKVEEGKQIRQGAVTRDGKGEVVTGIVMMLRGGNSRSVIASIEEKIDDVNKGLPKGVKVEKFYDQSDLINRTTSTLGTNLFEGGFLVIVILLLLLGEIKGALIVASVIPLSLLFAFIGMKEFGLAANIMSLGAIDFGMIVDGSVVMVENIVHKLQHSDGTKSKFTVIREAAIEVSKPIFFGVMIILMVYLPIMTFEGMEGILYRPMAITVATAVLGSLLLTLIFIPALSSMVFKKGIKLKKNYLMDWLIPKYEKFINLILLKRFRVLAVAISILVLSIILIPFLGTEFLPELDEGSILVEQVRMPSVTLQESVERANQFGKFVMDNIPEVLTVVPKTGRSDLANDWMGIHQTDVWIILKNQNEWRKGMTKEKIQDEMKPFLDKEPGLAYNFTQPIAMRVDELTSGVKSDVAVKIYGEELETLSDIGNKILAEAAKIEGTDNYYLERPIGQPYLNIVVDRQKIAGYGVNANDVQKVIDVGIGGFSPGQVFEGQRRFDLMLRYPEDMRNSIEEIGNLPVRLPNGGYVPIKELTIIKTEEGPREIVRENGWRLVIVSINIKDIDIGTYVAELKKKVEKLNVPANYFLDYGGAFENQQRAMSHLMIVVPLSLLIILGLLYMMFGQIRYALLIFINLPFALSGGIFLLWMRGMYLSVSASIGFVALFGVAVLNGIVLVEHINQLRRKGIPLRESVVRGAADRFRPVLMTALVASLGFIPMAFNTGPGSEVQRPLATVVIGGLITATLLTLLVLPTIYYWADKNSRVPGLKREE